MLNQLIQLFEKNPSFLKNWKKEISTFNKKLPNTGKHLLLKKIIKNLKNENYTKKCHQLFGM